MWKASSGKNGNAATLRHGEYIWCWHQILNSVILELSINCNYGFLLLPLQYYEMSYGLNVEMHKQVGGMRYFGRQLPP